MLKSTDARIHVCNLWYERNVTWRDMTWRMRIFISKYFELKIESVRKFDCVTGFLWIISSSIIFQFTHTGVLQSIHLKEFSWEYRSPLLEVVSLLENYQDRTYVTMLQLRSDFRTKKQHKIQLLKYMDFLQTLCDIISKSNIFKVGNILNFRFCQFSQAKSGRWIIFTNFWFNWI